MEGSYNDVDLITIILMGWLNCDDNGKWGGSKL